MTHLNRKQKKVLFIGIGILMVVIFVGGFLVFYVQPECQESVRLAMRDLMYIPFEFEDGGTRVIHYTPESYIPKE